MHVCKVGVVGSSVRLQRRVILYGCCMKFRVVNVFWFQNAGRAVCKHVDDSYETGGCFTRYYRSW